jgi:predicted pyridoxine 5'-phosphate oxidase superfamily flavin-nucleotide-binding protein
VSGWPFHAGELEAQLRAGGGAPGGGIRDVLPEQHRRFFAALPFAVVGTREAGWPLATVLAGAPGFVASPDPRTLRIAAPLDPSDPAAAALVPGAPAGLLGIELATRRRNRANGTVLSADAGGFVLGVKQAFGNCQKYIHPRDVRPADSVPGPLERLSALDAAARDQLARADTCFVATGARTDEQTGGVDVSHRGGPPGFVRVEGDVLTVPDYAGNRYFNTLGNLVSEPRAALVFVDFERGDVLHVSGTTGIVWDGPEVRAFPGAERLWRVRVVRSWRRRGALPLRWSRSGAGPRG